MPWGHSTATSYADSPGVSPGAHGVRQVEALDATADRLSGGGETRLVLSRVAIRVARSRAGSRGMNEKVVLAYSGGLDTSVILKWLIERGHEVVAFVADVGQQDDFDAVREKALKARREQGLRRGPQRRVRRRLHLPRVQGERDLRGALPARHRPRAAADREAPDSRRRARAGAVRLARSHGQGQRPGAIRTDLLRAQPQIKVIAPWKTPEFLAQFQGRSDLLAYASPARHRGPGDRRKAVQRGREPAAPEPRGGHPRRSEPPGRRGGLHAHRVARARARQADAHSHDVQGRHPGSDREPRRRDRAREAARAVPVPERARPAERHRSDGHGREPVRRDQVARRLRDARRHDPARRPSRHREHRHGPRGDAPAGHTLRRTVAS